MTSALITTDADVRQSVSRDASGLELIPDAVARPTSRDDVLELLREAQRDRTPVTTAACIASTWRKARARKSGKPSTVPSAHTASPAQCVRAGRAAPTQAR